MDLHLFDNFDISITNSTVFLLVAFSLLMFLFKNKNENGNVVPGRYQTILEVFYCLVYDMVKENIGKDGARYFPFLLALFLFGGATIREFLYVLIIGVVAGTYSSIAIASQILVVWDQKKIGSF